MYLQVFIIQSSMGRYYLENFNPKFLIRHGARFFSNDIPYQPEG